MTQVIKTKSKVLDEIGSDTRPAWIKAREMHATNAERIDRKLANRRRRAEFKAKRQAKSAGYKVA